MNKMPEVTIIIDGQYGSCGKGAICGYLSLEFDTAVRVGAPNAGHTLTVGNKKWKMQQIPVAALINHNIDICIGAAGLINEEVLGREMGYLTMGQVAEHLFIDRNAGILEPKYQEQEEEEKMFEGIGSTCEGVGAARRAKIKRDHTFKTAKDVVRLEPFICNVAHKLNTEGGRIMIEGTQGFMLSMNHGDYPYTTSCDLLPSSIMGDVGLAPQTLKDTIMVIRTYPIRVFGNSGPMCGKELTWEEVTKRSGSPVPLEEKTTVTKRVRRICEFDIELVKEACLICRPTQLAITFLDYISHKDYGITDFELLSNESIDFVAMVERETGIPVTLLKTGADNSHIIDLREIKKLCTKGSVLFDEGNEI